MSKVIGGACIGGIIAFIWMWISWTILPWHEWAFKTFEHEDFVGWVITENAIQEGVYTIPGMQPKGNTVKERKENREKQEKMLKKGPFIYAHVSKKGMDPMNPRLYIVSLLTQVVGAGIISFLLLQFKETCSYLRRFSSVFAFGIAVALLAVVPQWNWFATGADYALVMIADYIITWGLIGLVLALFVKPKGVTRPM